MASTDLPRWVAAQVLEELRRAGRDDLACRAAPRLLPRWALRAARLNERDAAIREAAAILFPGTLQTAAARALAAALLAYSTTGWPRDRDLSALPAEAGPRRRLLHRILRASEGKVPRGRQVLNILNGQRTPVAQFIPDGNCAA